MAAVEIVPRSDVDPEREQRHCPECGKVYVCKPHWRQKMCPACNGQRIARSHAQHQVGRPFEPVEVRPDVPAEITGLELEITAMRIAARWLEDLDADGRTRTLAWLNARYGGGV